MHCQQEKEKEKGPPSLHFVNINLHPSHYRRPTCGCWDQGEEEECYGAGHHGHGCCCIEDRGWRGTGLWSVLAAAGGWWWWGGHTSQLQPQHTLTTSHRGIRGGESFHNGRSICYSDHSLIIFNILSPPLIIIKNNFDLKISKWPKCHQKKINRRPSIDHSDYMTMEWK